MNTVLSGLRSAAAAGAAMIRGGLIGPIRPDRLVRMAAAAVRWGTSPATIVAVGAARWPDRAAIIDEAGSLTYAELDQRADTLAAALAHEYGVGPRRAVAIMCRNHRGFVEGMLAAGRLGCDVLLVNTELPAAQLGPTLARHDLGVVLHDEEFDSRLVEAGYAGSCLLAWHDDAERTDTAEALIAREWHRLPRPRRHGNLVLLTSGTTGAPKGVPRSPSARAAAGVALSIVDRLRPRAGDPMLVCPPLFHGFGIAAALLCLSTGGTLVLRRHFDAEDVARDVREHRVRTLCVVPVMLQRLLSVPDLPRYTGSLAAVLSGGAPLGSALATEFMDAVGDVLFNGYGSSEIGVATVATPQDLRAAPGTVGTPVLGTPVKILDERAQPRPAGETGRIFVGGPMTFDGYSGGGGAKEVVDGLVSTGDLGHLDTTGRLFIDGRADDMIVSGGENVFPQNVEDAIAAHPAVADVAVVGVADREFGQRLQAFVVPKPRGVDTDELRAFLRTRLTRYELPRNFAFVTELPRNATGKLLRTKLTDIG